MPQQQRNRELYDQFHFYLEFFHRLLPRWWVVLVATFTGGALAVALALLLPRVYESRALLAWQEGVSQRRVFSPGEASAADWTSLQGRLAFLVSSDTRLRRLIHDLDLYPRDRESMPELKVMEEMRKAIRFESLGGTSFWISFQYTDRYRAQAAVAQLVHDFIEENAGNALSSAVAARDLMESETQLARRQLEAIDHAMAKFFSEHPEFQTDPTTGMLRGRSAADVPSSRATRIAAAVSSPELRQALREKGRLEAQLRLTSGPPDQALTQARQDLAAAQRALVLKRERYTEAHPDVQHARDYVQQVEAQLKAAQVNQRSRGTAAEQLRQQIAALDARIGELARSKTTNDKPVVDEQVVSRKPRRRPVAAGHLLSASAQLEKRWYELTRDRTVQKAKYDLLQERLIKARMAADLEKGRALTQFEIIDPPNLPYKPVRPGRTRLAIGGTLLGLLVGLGLAGLFVIFDQRVYSKDDVLRACDLPVLALVPPD